MIDELRQRSEELFGAGNPVHLVTADGGFNCQEDPASQEASVARLHFAEVLTALSLLTPGGDFVLKMFTLFEACSVSLMYFLRSTFAAVRVVKPATSKAGNSEVYVVARGYAPGGAAELPRDFDEMRGEFRARCASWVRERRC